MDKILITIVGVGFCAVVKTIYELRRKKMNKVEQIDKIFEEQFRETFRKAVEPYISDRVLVIGDDKPLMLVNRPISKEVKLLKEHKP
jgi:thymidylate kinase